MTNNQTNVLDTLHGLGLPPSLDAAEAQTWRRWLPGGRVPWRELASFETEIAKLEERRREVERERDEIAARLQGAPAQDVEARARWERSGRRGARPEPSQPKLEAELKRCQDDLYALHAAIDKVSAERVAHVEKHRGRLSREAAEAAEKPTSA
jgi:chromosome segregation ATPase